jgi:hypothetical protein
MFAFDDNFGTIATYVDYIYSLVYEVINFPAKVYDVRNRDRSPRIFSNHPVDTIIRRLCLSVKTKYLEKLAQFVISSSALAAG